MFTGHATRRLDAVPAPVIWLLAGALILQVGWHGLQADPAARAEDLPAAPAPDMLRIASLGDPIALSRVLMLWLQVFDNQPGISIPFLELDYYRVIAWLDRILVLDPHSQYPLLAASRLYGAVPNPGKQVQMFDFVYEQFLEDPNRRWRWLAHAAIMAKHRLGDLPRALKYAEAITDKATGNQVPGWARQIQVFVLEQAGELAAARVLIGGLLASGQITDAHELRFLRQELERLEGNDLKEQHGK